MSEYAFLFVSDIESSANWRNSWRDNDDFFFFFFFTRKLDVSIDNFSRHRRLIIRAAA